jgi:hypothetical protein
MTGLFSAKTLTGAAMVVFVLALNVPYVMLMGMFGYDDILREPPGIVLQRFYYGGPMLVIVWLSFALGALAFAPLARHIENAAGLTPSWTGPASAIAQFVGLARWVFVVPILASAYVSADGQAAVQATLEVAFTTLHQTLGVLIGELLGQILLVCWTVRLAWGLRGVRPFLAWFGAATVPLWIVGFSELLATGLPDSPVWPTTPLAFMAWELWLLTLGVVWIAEGLRQSYGLSHASAQE